MFRHIFGGMTKNLDLNDVLIFSAEDEVSLDKAYSHDIITSLKGICKCQADTITVAECLMYEALNQ